MNLRPQPKSAPRTPAERRKSGLRIFAWATLAALVVGVLGLAQPVDDLLRNARNIARPVDASGQIVFVGIDDKSIETVGAWPWPRTRDAEMVDRLHAAGAERIFFDIFFNSPGRTRAEDRAFADAIRRAGNVTLAAGSVRNPSTGEQRPKLPLDAFRKHASLVSVVNNYSAVGSIRSFFYGREIGGTYLPSMAAALAGTTTRSPDAFIIDYAIRLKTVPRISAADVVTGKFDPSQVRGKRVLIAVASRDIGDLYLIPGVGLENGGYINVLGAETLMRGTPRDLGWLIPLGFGAVLTLLHVLLGRGWLSATCLIIAIAGIVGGPFALERQGIFLQIMPALVLVLTAGIWNAWSRFRHSYRALGNINAVSGLPNLNALRENASASDAVLVAARVRNFAEITAALPLGGERTLVDQIVARLSLGSRGAPIYQGDEGIFVWATTADLAGADQLEALHALFRSPALIDGKPIDVPVTLGIDTVADRDLANRIGAALVAADEAAAENLRWKAYDPAKLADAEWKLSLLGRLDAAIDSGEVWVAYQPQIEVISGRITGAEALVRWSHPEKGDVSPVEFVLAAEQHDRIDKLTQFVLADAIRVASGFAAQGVVFDVAVNISARLLERPGLLATVRRLLAAAGLPPERLTLEVTESAAMASGRASIRTLEELGSLGINVSIDDYGTGFSTLDYFKKIPATEVKIDRGFIAAIDRNASDRLMVRSTVELAHSLGRIVVAEGVETQEILAELRNIGCDKAQGYFIGRPMKLSALHRIMAEHRHNRAA